MLGRREGLRGKPPPCPNSQEETEATGIGHWTAALLFAYLGPALWVEVK